MSDDTLQRKIDFLLSFSIDKKGHSTQNLLDHLLGTYQILVSWKVKQEVCDAGLFHSVYGTESYQLMSISLSMRPQVQNVIGYEAEELAFLFGMMEKQSFYKSLFSSTHNYTIQSRLTKKEVCLKNQQYTDLCHLVLANWLEQRPRSPEEYQNLRSEEFQQMRSFLSEQATIALDEAYGFSQ